MTLSDIANVSLQSPSGAALLSPISNENVQSVARGPTKTGSRNWFTTEIQQMM